METVDSVPSYVTLGKLARVFEKFLGADSLGDVQASDA